MLHVYPPQYIPEFSDAHNRLGNSRNRASLSQDCPRPVSPIACIVRYDGRGIKSCETIGCLDIAYQTLGAFPYVLPEVGREEVEDVL